MKFVGSWPTLRRRVQRFYVTVLDKVIPHFVGCFKSNRSESKLKY